MMPDWRIFWLEFGNCIVVFEISILEFDQLQFREKMKMSKFGTKIALLGYF